MTAVAATDLRRLVHDRTALFFTVALPVMIIYIIGLAFGGEDFAPQVAVADLDRSPASTAAIDRLPDTLRVVTYDGEAAARGAVRAGDAFAGLVIPAGYGAAAVGGAAVEVALLTDPSRTSSAGMATLLQAAIEADARIAIVGRAVADEAGVPIADAVRTAGERQATANATVTSTLVGTEGPVDTGPSLEGDRIAAGNLVLFVFITSLAASSIVIRTRRLGIGRRALAAPVRPGVVLLGFAAGRFTIAGFQALIIVVAGAGLFGVQWGDPLAAFALVLTLTLAGTGAGLVAATVFRTEDQAGAVGPPVGIALGMLGGCMWPLEIVPAPMRAAGHLTPHAWAMDAFGDLFERGAGLGDIVTEVLVIAAFAAGLIAVGMTRIATRLADVA